MSWMDKLERQVGRVGIPHLAEVLIAGQVIAFIGISGNPSSLGGLTLSKSAVMHGEPWRLLTFLFVPFSDSLIWVFFAWYLFYLMGTALERFWGTFQFNLFLLIGYAASVVALFIAPDDTATNEFLYGSVFLAFAFLYPDFELLLFFILPVKIKWLALITWIGYGVAAVTGDWLERALIFASVLNFLIFFGPDLLQMAASGKRRMERKAASFAESGKSFHRCAVCGATEITHPREEFRYCPDCFKSPGYCSQHIKNHQHVPWPEGDRA